MGRKLTSPNPQHPHTVLKNHLQKTRETARLLSNEDLSHLVFSILRVARQTGRVPEVEKSNNLQYRHEMLNFIVAYEALVFKQMWKEEYGWEFNDSYDQKLYAQRVKEQMEYQQKRAEAKNEQPPRTTP